MQARQSLKAEKPFELMSSAIAPHLVSLRPFRTFGYNNTT
jgi:hypothetical protein